MQESQYLYRSLDNPIRVLFWSIDEFLVLAAPLFLSLCLGNLLFLVVGVIVKPVYSRIKKRFPNGAFKHRLYWFLPTASLKRAGRITRLPPSHCREYLM